MKQIRVSIDLTSWSNGFPPMPFVIYSNNLFKFKMEELMKSVVYSTKYPHLNKMLLNDYWALLRYFYCFSSDIDFKLSDIFKDVDAHQKTILSDDIGMGMAYCFMDATVGINGWVDTKFFLKYYPFLNPVNNGYRGNYKSPDFLVMDSNDEFYLIECKGTQNSITSQNKQIKDGKLQIQGIVDPESIIKEKLVMSSFIRYESSTKSSIFKIVDPEFNLDFSKVEKSKLKLFVMKYELFKELSFIYPDIFTEKRFNNYNIFKQYFQNNKHTDLNDIHNDIKIEFDGKILENIENFSNFTDLINHYKVNKNFCDKFSINYSSYEENKTDIKSQNKSLNKKKLIEYLMEDERLIKKIGEENINKIINNIVMNKNADLIYNKNIVSGTYGVKMKFNSPFLEAEK
ncbi:hypothetical protein [Macrococcus carouselicus]|uniref:Uncharacterized protein n=1 Tax=Macrococcus carouselicus TaxID=69969 RepID=A0A9Q8CP52_9STAP|nr:hypothetical protein [Macrococcus carouselicus]TDM04693.1 hypothetical protein ERX40_05905 [Macrococcus carouselicus]